jgi:hypothetical protein
MLTQEVLFNNAYSRMFTQEVLFNNAYSRSLI